MSSRFARSTNVEIAPMRDETVLFNPSNNRFCVLNSTAALIWGSLESPQTVSDLVSTVCARYADADRDVVEQDVRRTLDELGGIDCVVGVA